MATLFTPEFGKQRAVAGATPNEAAVRFQGDVGWGVMTEARAARLERAAQMRAGLHAAHGRGVDQ